MCATCGCSVGSHPRITDPAPRVPGPRTPAHEHLPGDLAGSGGLSHGHLDHGGHLHDVDHLHDHVHDHVHGHEGRPAAIPDDRQRHDPHVDDDDRAPEAGLPEDHLHPRQDSIARGGQAVDGRPSGRTIRIEQDVLAKNAAIVERNRAWLDARGITALNLTSSPGAGKTTLLERTIRERGGQVGLSVIEGDQDTTRDADRIRSAGARVVQINTGTGCHLDAETIARALRALDPPAGSILMIENVGNLVCPALFELGEHGKVVIMSVTEGEDKPLKYPHMFRASTLMLLSKVDLLPHLDFDLEMCLSAVHRVNPDLQVLPLSSRTGQGFDAWYAWLDESRAGSARSTYGADSRRKRTVRPDGGRSPARHPDREMP